MALSDSEVYLVTAFFLHLFGFFRFVDNYWEPSSFSKKGLKKYVSWMLTPNHSHWFKSHFDLANLKFTKSSFLVIRSWPPHPPCCSHFFPGFQLRKCRKHLQYKLGNGCRKEFASLHRRKRAQSVFLPGTRAFNKSHTKSSETYPLIFFFFQ